VESDFLAADIQEAVILVVLESAIREADTLAVRAAGIQAEAVLRGAEVTRMITVAAEAQDR